MALQAEQIRDFVEYLRDLGVYDFYQRGTPGSVPAAALLGFSSAPVDSGPRERETASAAPRTGVVGGSAGSLQVAAADRSRSTIALKSLAPSPAADVAEPPADPSTESSIPKPIPFNDLAPVPEVRVAPQDKPNALRAIRERIGDCTRCPLAYAGRHTIVFGDGDPNARILFVGEGPGADEDASGLPFVGKAGQLLNNMIGAMGLTREQVYIANIVKCRPPGNRAPEPVEANTCSQFLLEQMDVVHPKVVVALGATAATYLLGVKQSLSSLRGRWHDCRGAKLVVTYHPAFLLRDPRQKGEAWKDLQMVMAELGLKATAKT
jgi:uracil-DNA glycosylase family 4